MNIEALGIDRLSVGERLELIELIWDSLPEQAEGAPWRIDPADIPAWHLAELAKRRAGAEANPGACRPWREVLERLGPSS